MSQCICRPALGDTVDDKPCYIHRSNSQEMTLPDESITYKGKDIQKCSREELIACIEWCMKDKIRTEKMHKRDIELQRAFARRGL